MAKRLSTTYESARCEIERSLRDRRLGFTSYIYPQNMLNCDCTAYEISNVGKGVDGNNEASFTLTLQYTAIDVFDGECKCAQKNMVLNVLSTVGDNAWHMNNITKVWQADYPSAVAVEDSTGEVYFLFLRAWGLELRYFATIPAMKLDALETLHFDRPYRIKLNESVMFDFIEGDIGLIGLRKGVEVEFNTMIPLTVTLANYDRRVICPASVDCRTTTIKQVADLYEFINNGSLDDETNTVIGKETERLLKEKQQGIQE